MARGSQSRAGRAGSRDPTRTVLRPPRSCSTFCMNVSVPRFGGRGLRLSGRPRSAMPFAPLTSGATQEGSGQESACAW
eukprot:2140098-Rhodomonas_salina.1